jgi:hypothetical protein
MRSLITIFTLCFGLSVTGCSTTDADKSVAKKDQISAKILGLPAQDLAEGECGAFLWAETKPRQFVYFQKQDAAQAQFYSDGQTQTITTQNVTSYLGDAGQLDLDYIGSSAEKIKIKGVYDEEIEGGHRISPASIQVQSTDGWQQIIPVSGVFICR